MSGALGGFNVGCQYQFGWWLIGVEGDGAATNKDGQAFNIFLGVKTSSSTRRSALRQPDHRTLDGDRPPEARLGRRQVAVLHYRRRCMVGRRGDRVGFTQFPPSRRTTKGRSRVGPSVRAGNMRSAMAGRGRANSSISTTVGRSSSIRRMPVRPTVDAFLNPREVSLKNYVFRTGLNWRFDWGKAPVAVMAKY